MWPSPPPTPLPWTWTCHRCSTRYNIAVTRRCLSCSHRFCLWHAPRHPPVCAVEFDYDGWRAWMRWRRSLAPQAGGPGRPRDCSLECDYPSQCLHARYASLRDHLVSTGQFERGGWEDALEARGGAWCWH